MTALAADKKVLRKAEGIVSYLVKAAAQIYMGAMVTTKPATGYAYAGTNTVDDRFVGIALENVLGVTDDVERVRVYTEGVFQLVGAGLAITDIGLAAYLSDDQTITTTPTNVKVGTIVAVPSATAPWVRIQPTRDSLLVPEDLAVVDDLTVGGDLDVTGNGTVGGTLAVTGVATLTVPPVIPTIAFASLPSASPAGQLCYCATGSGGNPGLLWSDGTNWKDAMDGATAAES